MARAFGLSEDKIERIQAGARAAAANTWIGQIKAAQGIEGATASAFKVLQVLAECADLDDGGGCYPAQKTIAKRAGISRETVRVGIAQLLKLGYIERTGYRKATASGRGVAIYRVMRASVCGGLRKNLA